MWRLRFVIVPYYSLRFGFRPGIASSITEQSPLPILAGMIRAFPTPEDAHVALDPWYRQ